MFNTFGTTCILTLPEKSHNVSSKFPATSDAGKGLLSSVWHISDH